MLDTICRAALAVVAGSFLLLLDIHMDTRAELAEARNTAKANAQAVKDSVTSAAITEKTTAKQIKAAQATARAKHAAKQKQKEANNDETYRTWAANPAPAASWRLLREAAPLGSAADIAAPGAHDAMPGNGDTGKRP